MTMSSSSPGMPHCGGKAYRASLASAERSFNINHPQVCLERCQQFKDQIYVYCFWRWHRFPQNGNFWIMATVKDPYGFDDMVNWYFGFFHGLLWQWSYILVVYVSRFVGPNGIWRYPSARVVLSDCACSSSSLNYPRLPFFLLVL